MNEFLYNISSGWIAFGLLVSMVLVIEAGYRLGLREQRSLTESFKSHINAIVAAFLGILALLLGFNFSLSLQRYDNRSLAVLDEANAIGTAYLYSMLLPASVRDDTEAALRQYLDLRIQASDVPYHMEAERTALRDKATGTQAVLWKYAQQAAVEAPDLATTEMFIQALSGMIDSLGRHDAAFIRHVPQTVLLLMYLALLLTGAIIGYSSGVANHRPSFVIYIIVVLIVVLAFIIVDLDRPWRGLIQVSQQSLIDLQATINAGTFGDVP